MTPETVSERLRLARSARESDVAAFARRIGVRVEHVCAIEDGRFGDLPAGIYGRSAIKACATACGLDAAEILAAVESRLAAVGDPIAGLARLKGLHVPAPQVPAPPAAASAAMPSLSVRQVLELDTAASWRALGAALVDALIVTALLLIVVLAAVTTLVVPVSALEPSSPAFGVMGVLLALGYYLCFGGIGGATVGERIMHASHPPDQRTLTLHAVATRALQSASEDVRCLCSLGVRVGRWLALAPAAYGDDASTSS